MRSDRGARSECSRSLRERESTVVASVASEENKNSNVKREKEEEKGGR